MSLFVPKTYRTLGLLLGCSTLVTACGSDDAKTTSYSSASTGYSSLAASSQPASASALSSLAASSEINSSETTSSESNSSAAAITPPIALLGAETNSADGDYFVAQSEVWVTVPSAEDNSSFSSQKLERSGFSLYTFANDSAAAAMCNGNCLASWPALLAAPNAQASAPYSLVERSMGTAGTALQWAYNGKPLYFFKNDLVAGQTAGKAISNWQLARPQPWTLAADAQLASHLAGQGRVKLASYSDSSEQVSSEWRQGFSLYTFANDTPGTSNCKDSCLTNWPALIAHQGAIATAPYSLVERSSGSMQWALNGMPLYFYAGDTAAGETKGEGVGNKWRVARAAPLALSAHPEKGNVFVGHGNVVDSQGMADTSKIGFSLYTFGKDTNGQSNCSGSCIANWPPLYAISSAQAFGDFTIIERSDAGRQWAYLGQALYFYAGDSAAGDVKGEIPNWSLARVQLDSTSQSSSALSSSSASSAGAPGYNY